MSERFVYMTMASADQARKIGRALVEERLAACVNILAPMQSIYRWEGKIIEDNEAVLIAKSRDVLVERLTARVKELHSYSVPCVVALPIVQGNPDYLRWIGAETSAPARRPED